MTSQSTLTVIAPVDRAKVSGLRELLATMNNAPGRLNPGNELVPFEKIETLHFAKFAVLDDGTLDDIRLYNLPRVEYPVYLAIFCEFDGKSSDFVNDLVRCARPGLGRILAFCDGFSANADLTQWIQAHDVPVAASYVNWRGRTVKQVREEAALRHAIRRYLESQNAAGQTALQIHANVGKFVDSQIAAGALTLTPPAETPLGETIANILHFFGAALILLLVSPVIILLLVFRIRPEEQADPVYAPVPSTEHVQQLSIIEDHESTNQFIAMGSLKPGLARLWVMRFALAAIDWAARYIYTKGRLARVRTIHFARWVFLDDKKRAVFTSNYDGSLDSYMDDFINKVSFGLNASFSSGVGYPTTRWLLADGATDEQTFKYYLRRHQLPADVWYDAHPGMTVIEMEHNGRIRDGLRAALSEEEAREWVQLL